jgi:hypothetical protein
MKKLCFLLLTIIIFSLSKAPVQAYDQESGPAAQLVENSPEKDPRIPKLEAYLNSYNPVIAPLASRFISEADRVGLDWKLVVAISGVESTFCRQIPVNSANCWGWGIPTGKPDGIHFTSVSNGITIVSEGLKFNYLNKGYITLDEIGHVYAASPLWAYKVRNFMQQIDNFQAIASNNIPSVNL